MNNNSNENKLFIIVLILTLFYIIGNISNYRHEREKQADTELNITVLEYGYVCGMRSISQGINIGRYDQKYVDSLYSIDSIRLIQMLK